jgi:hypothetical protein
VRCHVGAAARTWSRQYDPTGRPCRSSLLPAAAARAALTGHAAAFTGRAPLRALGALALELSEGEVLNLDAAPFAEGDQVRLISLAHARGRA